ncbi:MAG: hypothetical protein US86_C0003G0095 [Candidatus Daviesbacteria bacterium GW2011_GWA2_38_24]|uniref:Uncharacterized protein n=1 Tax=Candidatus Daviesbacteria bacterium GW2011_GWA2_38_24 TaxID=1618422 RepID=A0A0G0JJ54_9BACT|nr:MAG: hypothetical protein US86_C0003G0095 [Candidatus Daviesbacteria bacterium GW2011_GWA2_38_24]KKQ80237.1 MAG: hypothetical protein UT01_C0016G0018 [Candidatus Daviesbacteria bacterium GW2011_GWA1_38_7]
MKFRTNNQTYKLILQRKDFKTKDPFGNGLAMFTVLDEHGEETIGCISFGASLLNTLTSNDKSKSFLTSEKSELLYASLLPHLELDIEQLTRIYTKGLWCIAYFFDSKRETGFSEDDQIYYIKIQDGFYKTIQNIIFDGEITNDKIQRKILEILYNHWEEDSITNILLEDLEIMIPIEPHALYRNFKALEEEDKVQIQYSPSDNTKIISVKIKGEGRKDIEGRKNTPPSAIIEYVMGHKITASTTGNQSPIVIGENINIAFGDIITEIENEGGENKEEVIELVRELKSEMESDKNPDKITNLLSQIKEKASWVNEKILSNPFLSQLLAIILANKMGLV